MARKALLFILILIAACFLASAQGPLDFSGAGAFGQTAMSRSYYSFTPSGGTPPYSFSYSPGATQIPGFRVTNRPDIPNFAPATATGALVGLPLVPGNYSTSIRLTDSTGAFVDKAVSFKVSAVDILGT